MQSCYRSRYTLSLTALAALTLMHSRAYAGGWVNALNVGWADASLWCKPNQIPNPRTCGHTTPANTPFPWASAAWTNQGCTTCTENTWSYHGWSNAQQRYIVIDRGFGGDQASGGSGDLLPHVTPTSAFPSSDCWFQFVEEGGNVRYSGAILLSDAGAAVRFRWYDLNTPAAPIRESLYVGPANEPFEELLPTPSGGLENLVIEWESIAVSLEADPIPSASQNGIVLLLLLMAVAGIVALRGRRPPSLA